MNVKTIQEKRYFLESKDEEGGHYCEAIDGNWTKPMPFSGYWFQQRSDGTVKAYWNDVFACYDGWDSRDIEAGTYKSIDKAVTDLWYTDVIRPQAKHRMTYFRDMLKRSKRVRDKLWEKTDAELFNALALRDFFNQELKFL